MLFTAASQEKKNIENDRDNKRFRSFYAAYLENNAKRQNKRKDEANARGNKGAR